MKRFPPPFRVPSAQLYLSTSWILSGNLLHLYYMQTGGKVKCFSAQKEGDMLEVPGKMPYPDNKGPVRHTTDKGRRGSINTPSKRFTSLVR